MRKISADFVFPVSAPPIKEGVVCTDQNGIIVSLSSRDEFPKEEIEIYSGILCPGFINSHCHLELSFLKNKIQEGGGLDNFIRDIEFARKDSSTGNIENAMLSAEKEMITNGIVAVGDISNDDASLEIKSKKNLIYHTFIEIYGFDPGRAGLVFNKGKKFLELFESAGLSTSLSPHAPYSVSEKLLELINTDSDPEKSILSIHHLENDDETDMFFHGKGKIMERLKKFGVDPSFWEAPRQRPLSWLLPKLSRAKKILLVHNTFSTKEDWLWLKNQYSVINTQAFLCLCPNANLFIENNLPDIRLIASSGFPVCIGTDSLASNKQLSVLEEIKTIQNHFSDIPLNTLLEWATLNGARFLGLDTQFGSFGKGKKPGINLIENLDMNAMRIQANTSVKKIS